MIIIVYGYRGRAFDAGVLQIGSLLVAGDGEVVWCAYSWLLVVRDVKVEIFSMDEIAGASGVGSSQVRDFTCNQ